MDLFWQEDTYYFLLHKKIKLVVKMKKRYNHTKQFKKQAKINFSITQSLVNPHDIDFFPIRLVLLPQRTRV